MLARCFNHLALALGALLLLAARGPAGEDKKGRDIFDYDAQKAAKGVKRIVFIADTAPHGPRGNHEFLAGAIYLARTINARYPDAYAVVHTMKNWPKDLKHADTVIVLLNHGRSAVNPAVKEAMARGAGFMAIHYGVEVNKGEQGQHYLKWLGGYFEPEWSVNPFWTPEFKDIPKHETTRGVKPFKINDEWYYHMRFVDGMKGVTPVLSAIAPPTTITTRWTDEPWFKMTEKSLAALKKEEVPEAVLQKLQTLKEKTSQTRKAFLAKLTKALDKGELERFRALVLKYTNEGIKPSSHAGNPGALADVLAGKPQVVAWAYERPEGGRGFGFTGLHRHENLGDANMRTLLLNAVAWVSHLPVPEGGVTSTPLSRSDLEQLIDDGRLAVKRRGDI